MTAVEKLRYALLTAFRSFISILDLAGVLAIGYLATSIALFISQGSDSKRFVSLGSLHLPAANIHSLPSIVVLILSLFLLKAVLSLWLTRQTAIAIANVEARSARVMTEFILGSGNSNFKRMSRDEVIYLVQNGSPSAFNGLLNAVSTLVSEGFLFVLLVVSLLFVDLGVTIGMLIYFSVIGALIQYLVGGRMQRAGETLTRNAIQANVTIGDLFSVNRELRLAGRRRVYIDRIYAARKNAAISLATQAYLAGTPRHIVESSLLLGISGFGLMEALTGNLVSAATVLGVFLTGGFRIMASMLPLQTALISIKGSIPNARPALEVLSSIPPVERRASTSSDVYSPPRIRISSLEFSYIEGGDSVLKGLDLEIESGTQVAFIGESGSGKSTLGEIIAGILEPSNGSVTIDGAPASHYVASHPGAVSIVPQSPGRIAGTILDNITLGQEPDEVDIAGVQRALKLAHLEDVVKQLPAGLETDLGKHSDALSGGQLQRLGLARALYTGPRVLILDEATSGLDANSEHEIGLALNELRGSITTIVIAHRLNTIKKADRIYLFESGKISASGTFEDLARVAPKLQSAIKRSRV